jgi:hypothetical protein
VTTCDRRGSETPACASITSDKIARRFEVLRTSPNYPAADALRYSGFVRIELTYQDSDGCYAGKVVVDSHTYSVSIGPPAIGYGPGVADSPEAYDRAAHAALSFAAADTEWEGLRHLHAGRRARCERLGHPWGAALRPIRLRVNGKARAY